MTEIPYLDALAVAQSKQKRYFGLTVHHSNPAAYLAQLGANPRVFLEISSELAPWAFRMA